MCVQGAIEVLFRILNNRFLRVLYRALKYVFYISKMLSNFYRSVKDLKWQLYI